MVTETLLAFATDYGLYVVSIVVFLAAIGIPLPSSILVLTSGGLAASGDLSILQLFLWTIVAYTLGDQTAYQIGKGAGPHLLDKLSSYKRISSTVQKTEQIYQQYGVFAIILSRTVISPTGPYMSYICGAWEMKRLQYSIAALLGSSIWACVYIMLGYTFAGEVPEISDLMTSIMIVGIAVLFALGFGLKLHFSWKKFKTQLA